MIVQFLNKLAPFIYFTWPVIFIIRFILNYHIYELIGKEEMGGTSLERQYRGEDNMLALFTFRWSADFMEDDDPDITRLMRTSNILNIAFIIHTVLVVALWMFLYGRK
ncbi:hypothetical protein EGT74_25330 [Chitinophaga lutea]|uniref:Uncharacterized protein n=2 Tax=Chitinophaga lutea TaxID=2488634 RepID=A0A3N4PAL6_9BACT|nr:hypothetical protein EGT74_25330 [Chitinophaga lutea]